MWSEAELERYREEAQQKWQHDMATLLEEAEERGAARAEAKAVARILADHVRFCQRWLRQPETDVEDLRRRSLAELKALQKTLNEQLFRALPQPPSEP